MSKKTSTTSSVEEIDEQRRRKKQAKREAKLMLEIQEAKVSIQRAEKKLAKVRSTLEAHNSHLRTLEADLTELHASHKEAEGDDQPDDSEQAIAKETKADEDATTVPDVGSDHHSGQPDLQEASSSNQ